MSLSLSDLIPDFENIVQNLDLEIKEEEKLLEKEKKKDEEKLKKIEKEYAKRSIVKPKKKKI